MNESPATNIYQTREAFLEPATTFRDAYPHQFDDLEEFRQLKRPSSYEDLLFLFMGSKRMLLWISETALITNDYVLVYQVATAECIQISFDQHKWGEEFFLVSLNNMQDLYQPLESLLALQYPNVEHFSVRLLSSDDMMGQAQMECPISQGKLGQLLQIESLEFFNMQFDESQVRLLARNPGTKKLSFISCELNGFAEAFTAAGNNGARELKFTYKCPTFTSGQLAQISASAQLQRLWLDHVNLTPESAHDLATANLEELKLSVCQIDRTGEVEFISQLLLEQQCPRGLTFQFVRGSFCQAFPRRLRGLSLTVQNMNYTIFHFQGYDFLPPFLSSLEKNCGLEDITFQIHEHGDARQTTQKVLRALRNHPTFLRLKIKGGGRQPDDVLRAPRQFCEEVAAALEGNSQIEEIEIERLEGSEGWDDLVAPLFQYNFYRKRIPGILATGSARAGLLGAAIASSRGKHPSAMCMLLSSNRDCIAVCSGCQTKPP